MCTLNHLFLISIILKFDFSILFLLQHNYSNDQFVTNGKHIQSDGSNNQTWGCPLENDREPIQINNVLEFIYIFDYGFFNRSSPLCIWRFNATEKYGFKVVILQFTVTQTSEIFVKNSTNIFVNKRSAKLIYPYYNEDNYLEIKLSNNNNTEFFAYLTLINKTDSVDVCKTHKNATATFWFLDTWKHGNFLNVKCFYELIIPEFTEIIVTIKTFIIETNVDYIRYYTDKYIDSVSIELNPIADAALKLYNYRNGSNTRYIFEYSNDGSVASLGNYISFYELKCKCGAQNIGCHGGAPGIMDGFETRYCGNLKCTFIFVPCFSNDTSMNSMLLQLTFTSVIEDSVQDESDIFRVYSNGIIVNNIEINYFEKLNEIRYFAYLNPSSYNVLEVETFPSKIVKSLYMFTKPTSIPSLLQEFEISKHTPFIVIDSKLYESGVVKIKVSKDVMNSTLSILSSVKHGLPIYNNESLSISLNSRSCFGDLHLYSCNLKNDQISIFCQSTFYFPIFTIQLQDYHQSGCIFQKYIFVAEEQYNIPIVAISTSNDICVATILITVNEHYHYFISKLWTSSTKENVKLFAGTDSFLMEFNSQTAKKWTSIGLYSNIYTIKVPKGNSVYIHLQRLDKVFNDYPTVTIFQDNFYSLMSTVYFGTTKHSSEISPNIIEYCVFGRRMLKFTVIYFNAYGLEVTVNGSTAYNFNKNGNFFILENNCALLVYIELNELDNNDGAIIFLETII